MQISRLSATLERDFEKILRNSFGMNIPDHCWVCSTTMAEVADSTCSSYIDARNRYPYSISYLKQIAITTFWIVKLKPINNVMLFDKNSGKAVDFPDINEAVAIYWCMMKLSSAIKNEKLSEVVTGSPENMKNVRETIIFYYQSGFYRNVETHEPIVDSNKADELTFNLRFKKFTAVNIYEVLCHLILPFRVLKSQKET